MNRNIRNRTPLHFLQLVVNHSVHIKLRPLWSVDACGSAPMAIAEDDTFCSRVVEVRFGAHFTDKHVAPRRGARPFCIT